MRVSLSLLLIFLWVVAIDGRSTPDSPTYRAGVIEFTPSFNPDPKQKLLENLNGHLKILNDPEAADLDIIVIAEYVLNYFETAVFVPDPARKVSPCDSNEFDDHDMLKQLSCAAKKGQKYIVVNLIEKKKCSKNCPENRSLLYYNTTIVFDRNGTIIARYRKYHLFNEAVDTPEAPELVTFDTDFGVTFGILICFDLNFYNPSLLLIRDKNITDFVFSTDWYSELPHGTAIQIQQNWAFVNDVNLLAAGANKPWEAGTGSGIYAGKLGPLNSIISSQTKSKLLTATVPKRDSGITYVVDQSIRRTPQEMESLFLLREDIDNFTSVSIPLHENSFERRICDQNSELCCDFKLNMTFDSFNSQDNFYRYRAVVYDGIRIVHGIDTGIITTCYIIACLDNSVSSCGYRFKDSSSVKEVVTFQDIKIEGNFTQGQNDFYIPNSVDRSIIPLGPSEFSYFEQSQGSAKKFIQIELTKKQSNLLSFGIFGRRF